MKKSNHHRRHDKAESHFVLVGKSAMECWLGYNGTYSLDNLKHSFLFEFWKNNYSAIGGQGMMEIPMSDKHCSSNRI